MIILKILAKIILFPIFLIMCFITTWVSILSKFGSFALGLFYLIMAFALIKTFSAHDWFGVGLYSAMSFMGFLVAFAIVAIEEACGGICDFLGKALAS